MTLTLLKCEPSYSAERGTWRLHIRYVGAKGEKRTYLALPLRDERRDAKAAKARAVEFTRKLDPLWHEWIAKHEPKSKPHALAAPQPAAPVQSTRRPDGLTLGWLLTACLSHDEVWGRVARPANYRSSVATLSALAGDWPISVFEPANGGRAKVMEIVDALRARKLADGTVRKLIGVVHQALRAAIGDGVSAPITHHRTGESLLSDVPAFPRIPKSKPRDKVIDGREEAIIFAIIAEKEMLAAAEERAFKRTLDAVTDDKVRDRKKHGWDRSPRFTSQEWRWYNRLVTLLIETGMRRGEGLYCGPHTLNTIDLLDDEDDVTDTVPVISLPALVTKTSEPRDVNISQTVADMIAKMNAEAGPVTRIYKCQTVKIEAAWCPLTEDQCGNLWIAVRKAAKAKGVDLSDVVLHTLRHTNATRLRRKAMPIDELARHLGHANIATTLKTYEHVGNQKTAMSSRFFAGKSIRRADKLMSDKSGSALVSEG